MTPTISVHIRKKASKTPFGMSGPRYMRYVDGMQSGAIRDPQRETLCGAPAGQDMSWAETRWESNRAHVTCPECIDIRVAAILPANSGGTPTEVTRERVSHTTKERSAG